MGNNKYYKLNEITTYTRNNASKAASVDNIEKWVCDAYQIKPDSDNKIEGGCNKVDTGVNLNKSLLPGVSDYVQHIYTYYKELKNQIATLCEGNTIKNNDLKDGAGNDKTSLVQIKSHCNGHRYPTLTDDDNTTTIESLLGKIISLHDFLRIFIKEYKARILHNMYKNTNEIVDGINTISALYYAFRNDLLGNRVNTDDSTIFVDNTAAGAEKVKIAHANIMKQITKIVIALDKGTSFYEDENGEKITSRLTALLKPDTLIQAKNKTNQGDIVINALHNLMNDCICYSDCTDYSVCFCYGNCNHY